MSVFIIAEVGINHNGDLDIAKKMIKIAKEAGVDCVKFQTFKASEFVSDPKQEYSYISQGNKITESMLEMFQRYEFNKNEWKEIVDYCSEQGITFSSTAQNISDLVFLESITKLPFIKVGSDDLTNLELLNSYAKRNAPMIISAGMAYAYEIEDAIRTIKGAGNADITVLHCISSYPTDAKDVNLKKIPVIRDAFGVKVGFSDHTVGSQAAVGAICFGARIIEKHFTLDNNMAGPDHWFSINPEELTSYVNDIRFIERAVGKGSIEPTLKEKRMREIARRKIVATSDLIAGTILTREDLDFKRSEMEGISPKDIKYVINRKLKRMVAKNNTIVIEDF